MQTMLMEVMKMLLLMTIMRPKHQRRKKRGGKSGKPKDRLKQIFHLNGLFFFFMLHFLEVSSGALDDMSMFDFFLSYKERKVSLVPP